MKTILAPVDFSKASASVVKEAAAFAHALGGRVVLLAVVQPPLVLNEYAAVVDIVEVAAAGEKNAARQLDRLEEALKKDSIKTETVQVTGTPVTRILEQAEKEDADYIVMGSHGHTAFYDLLVGSTTHGVLMRAKCPVVIVPSPKDEPKPRKAPRRSATR